MNNKGVSEIVSQILLMLVTVVVVGIIIAAIVPQMSRGKSQIKFEESKLLRDNLFSSIQEVYNGSIGYTKEISLKLENLSLNIDGDTETIEIYSIIDGEFYKDGLRQEEGNGKYTYRKGQKLYAGFTLENIDIVRSYVLENQLNATIYLRKTDKDKITILLENVIEDHWFTSSNLGLYNETPSTWQYRKKILIDGNKVDGNLTNFPVLIYLEDQDLKDYANADGNDIIFTLGDGKTKLKREIESYSAYDIYTYRKKITIDYTKVDSNLTDFPILVFFTDSNLATFAKVDGSDIYFTLPDGTRLKREIEDYNSETGTLIAWVKIPELSSTEDTNIYMYFGNDDENNSNDTDVWDNNYISVWHKSDFNSTTILDSTFNNITGTKSTSPPLQTIGKIGKAQMYNNQHISIGQNKLAPLLNGTTGITVTAWIKPNSLNTEGWILFEYINATSVIFTMRTHSDKTFSTSGRSKITDGSQQHYSTATLNENEWQYVVIQADYTNTKQNTYYNGIFDNNSTPIWGNTTLVTGTPSSDARIGNHQTAGRNFDGIIDELRVSKTVRSPSWIKTEYNNQSSPQDFYTTGEMETITTPHSELFAWVKIPELTTEADTPIYIYFGNENANETNDKDVWDEYSKTIIHFREEPKSNDIAGYSDSTINNNTGTLKNFNFDENSNTGLSGKIGNSVLLDGLNDYIEITQPTIGDYITYSHWINKKFTDNRRGTRTGYGTGINNYIIYYTGNNFGIYLGGGTPSAGYHSTTSNDIKTNDWSLITWTYNLSELKLYIDGILKRTISVSRSSEINNSILNLGLYYGCAPPTCYENFYGYFDELRISNIVRSSEWIKTEYNNQSIPEEFIKIGILEKI